MLGGRFGTVGGVRRAINWIFELFDSPVDFFVTELSETGGTGVPLIFPIGAPVSLSNFFGGYLLDQDGIHRVCSFLHREGPYVTDPLTDRHFDRKC